MSISISVLNGDAEKEAPLDILKPLNDHVCLFLIINYLHGTTPPPSTPCQEEHLTVKRTQVEVLSDIWQSRSKFSEEKYFFNPFLMKVSQNPRNSGAGEFNKCNEECMREHWK